MNRQDIINTILKIMKSRMTHNYAGIEEETKFEDLGFDSLDMLEVIMLIEDEFNISIPLNEAQVMRKVSDLIDFVFSKVVSKK